MTRAEFLTRVRQMSDTLQAVVDYPDAFILDLATMVHADEWRSLLDASPYYRTQEYALTLDDNRTFAWSALSSGVGNARKNVYRVLALADADGRHFTYSQPDRLWLLRNSATANTRERLWSKNGDRVQVFGESAGKTVYALVNWTPTPVGDLASDADPVDWLDEWWPVLIYETAALTLSRGGREMDEATRLIGLGDKIRQRMLASLKREASTPYIIGADDDVADWGSWT
jgi:hypothetical protein